MTRKTIAKKAILLTASFILAFALWMLLLYFLVMSGFGSLAVIISHLSFIGWILYGVISYKCYRYLSLKYRKQIS